MTASDDLMLAELLCARLCHDLAGPVGAAAAGAELLDDLDGEADPETLGLVADSAAGAAARLKFFRAALGPATAQPQPAERLRDLGEAYLRTAVSAAAPGLSLEWRVEPAEIDGERARLLLNLLLLARDALPRGGAIEVRAVGVPPALDVTAKGEPALLGDEARAVLVDGATPQGPRGAQAFLARRLSERLGLRLSAAQTPEGLRLHCEGAPPFQSHEAS